MKPYKLSCLALALLLALVLSAPAWAAEFSGILVMEGAGGVLKGKAYVKGNMVRHEAKHPKLGEIVTIINAVNRSAQIMVPTMRFYYDTVIPAELVAGRNLVWEGAKSLPKGSKKTGEEKISGLVCQVFSYQDPDAGTGQAWISKKLDFPLKLKGRAPQGSYLVEFSQVQTATQPASLFRPPSDYRRMQVDPKALQLLLNLKM